MKVKYIILYLSFQNIFNKTVLKSEGTSIMEQIYCSPFEPT